MFLQQDTAQPYTINSVLDAVIEHIGWYFYRYSGCDWSCPSLSAILYSTFYRTPPTFWL